MSILITHLPLRSQVLRAIRAFFYQNDFIEVETPVRIAAPAQEEHIDAPPAGRAWLRPSPELEMKQLLVAGCQRIFQIGPCFRDLECGQRHNPEFTMLEWYRAAADYQDILDDTISLVTAVTQTVSGAPHLVYQGTTIDLTPPWQRLSVQEAYLRWAGWDPLETWDAERFDWDMVKKIEPALSRTQPTILYDYPTPAASLAKLRDDDPRVAQRWECYIGGLEIANAYSELCEAETQRQRFKEAAQIRATLQKPRYPMAEAFLSALERGLPPCGGIALGVDRLVMLLADVSNIAHIRPFCQRPGALL